MSCVLILAGFVRHASKAKAAIARVKADLGSVTVVLDSELPAKLEGVKALAIDGKRYTDPGYSLVGKATR